MTCGSRCAKRSENRTRIDVQGERADLQARFGRFSDGEQHVLNRVCEGLSNKQIAAVLDVSLRTVESRRRRILERTQCQSFPELLLTYQTFKTRFDNAGSAEPQV